MPLVLADRVRETTTTTGTGTISLAGPVSGFQGFGTAIGNANTTYYTIVDAATGAWEVGLGTYTSSGSTLARTTVLSSSNSDALVPFGAGTKDVFVTQPAERAVYILGAGTGLAAGAAAFTANGVPYADSTSTLATSSNLTFNGTTLTANALTTTSTVTINGGTANGVAYLNGSKVLTTGSALTFTGSVLGVNNAGDSDFKLTTSNTGSGSTDGLLLRINSTGSEGYLWNWEPSSVLIFGAAGSEQMRLTTTGLGIGESSPAYKLDVKGTINSGASTATGYNLVFRTSGITTGRVQTSLTNTSGDFWTGIEGSTAGQTLTGSAAYSAFAGTFTANPLYLVTNGGIRATLDSSGNLGIGTSSPTGRLQVAGAFASQNNIVSITSSGVSGAATGAVRALYVNAQTANTASSVYGVFSEVTYTNSQTNYGGYFSAGDPTGASYGVYGLATQTDVNGPGTAYGGYFKAAAGASGSSGITYGARVENAGAVGAAAYGLTVSTVAGASTVVPFQVIHAGTERMRLDSSGNLGIGTSSPAYKLHVSNYMGLGTQASSGAGAGINMIPSSTLTNWFVGSNYVNPGAFEIIPSTAGGGSTFSTPALVLNSSGNLGLGVTPSAGVKLQLPNAELAGWAGTSGYLVSNTYYGSGDFRYVGTGAAARYQQVSGAHAWLTAPSGTAGNAISFTQAMTLDASGNLGIGTSSPSYKLQVQMPSSGIGAAFRYLGGTNNPGLFFTTNESTTVSTIDASGSTSGILALATSGSERARITSGGYFKASNNGSYFGSTGAYHELRGDSTGRLFIFENYSSSAAVGGRIHYSAQAPNNTGAEFLYCSDTGGERASIRSNGGLANYSGNNVNLSDRREKTNFAPAKSYLDTICAIPVQTFNYIDQSEDDPGLTLGVVAQDVQAVAPELVMESNWGTEEDPKMRLSIYQTDLQYALMKALQELKAEFDAYKATHP